MMAGQYVNFWCLKIRVCIQVKARTCVKHVFLCKCVKIKGCFGSFGFLLASFGAFWGLLEPFRPAQTCAGCAPSVVSTWNPTKPTSLARQLRWLVISTFAVVPSRPICFWDFNASETGPV